MNQEQLFTLEKGGEPDTKFLTTAGFLYNTYVRRDYFFSVISSEIKAIRLQAGHITFIISVL